MRIYKNYIALLSTLLLTATTVLIYQIGVFTRNEPLKVTIKPPPVPPRDYWTHLWRPREKNTHHDRILEQRNWIQHMVKKGAWNNTPRKNILVFDADRSYFKTKGAQILCHGGYELNSRCKITKRKSDDTAFRKLRSFDAIVTPHSWIYLGEIRIPFPSMKHILYNLEAPQYSEDANPIDLTTNNIILASYSSDSDIPIPYAKWIPNAMMSVPIKPPSKENFAKGKTKQVAIFVSNCNDNNGRLDYAQELNTYIPVDIYGNCGSLSCSKSNQTHCFALLKQQYKFYLAFENSNCREYISEKFFRNALENDVIPIVMGAHPDDYRAIAPTNSYIHVEDFDSPESLGNYLNVLNKNDTMYNQYFSWKTQGQFLDTAMDFFCRVCGLLYYSDYRLPPVWPLGSTYKNTYSCLSSKDWYWNR